MVTPAALALMLATGGAAWGATGWQPFGPERGHVVDVAVGARRVSVATRVEVLTADPELSAWERDPRFPPDTRRLAYGPDGTGWAATPGQLWRVTRDTSLVAELGAGSHAVDLAVTGEGTLIAAVRGQAQGVHTVRWEAGQPVTERLLPALDPWCVIADGADVWVGTVSAGLWHSDDGGRDFDAVVDDVGITALAWVDGEAWAALSDGRVLAAERGETVATLPWGWATSMADAGDRVLATAEGPGHVPPLFSLEQGRAEPEPIPDLEPGTSLARPTGVWALAGDDVLVGTFRLGPLRLDGTALTPVRNGFRSGVIGGAATGPDGELIVALMGTGVYEHGQDGRWQVQSGASGPVTDAVHVENLGTGVVVLDFEGVAWRGASGRWSRLKGVEVPHTGRRNALIDVGVDARGAWWAVDVKQQLYKASAQGWQPCGSTPVTRLDGAGEHLVAAGAREFLRPVDCDTPLAMALDGVRVNPPDSRVVGAWLAAPGQLLLDGERVDALPSAPVVAVAAQDGEILIASADGTLTLCSAEGCGPAAAPTREPAAAVGWLPDGRLWVAEARGTLLVGQGSEVVPARSSVALHDRPKVDIMALETAPWSREGVAGNAPEGAPDGGVLPSHLKDVAGPGQRAPIEAPAWQQPPARETRVSAEAPGSPRWPWVLGLLAAAAAAGLSLRRSRR